MKPDIQIPNIFRTLSNIYKEIFYSEPLSKAYIDSQCTQDLSIFRTQDIQYWESWKYILHRSMCSLRIFTTLVHLSPNILRGQGIIKNLSHMYDRLFPTEPCVTLICSELKAHSQPCQESMMEKFIHNLV